MKILILKLLTDTISKKEIVLLKNWLQKAENKRRFESYVKSFFMLNLLLQEPDVDKAYKKVESQIISNENSTRRFYPIWFKHAAIFVGILFTSFMAYKYVISQKDDSLLDEPKITLELEDGTIKSLNENSSEIITDKKGQKLVNHKQNILFYNDEIDATGQLPDKVVYNQLTVPYGKKFQLILSDSTHVYLNSGSKLKYPVKFPAKGDRLVFLDGEGYFSVSKNQKQQFVVQTEDANTVVLGTQFNVSSYKNEDNTSTVLVEGAVRVENQDNAVNISPGQRATLENGNITIDEVNIEKHIAWTKNQLYFVDDSFEIITKELERHFNAKILCNSDLLSKKLFTGTFETESLHQILTAFQLHSNFEYQSLKNNTIIIKAN